MACRPRLAVNGACLDAASWARLAGGSSGKVVDGPHPPRELGRRTVISSLAHIRHGGRTVQRRGNRLAIPAASTRPSSIPSVTPPACNHAVKSWVRITCASAYAAHVVAGGRYMPRPWRGPFPTATRSYCDPRARRLRTATADKPASANSPSTIDDGSGNAKKPLVILASMPAKFVVEPPPVAAMAVIRIG